jgi:hypothetical protein
MNKIFFGLLFFSFSCASLRGQKAPVPNIRDKEARSHLLQGVDPLYPPIAKLAHVGGEAVFYVDLNADGHVTKMSAVSCPAMLVTTSAEAIRGWKFAPFQVEGKDAAVIVEIKLAFPTVELRAESKIDSKVAESLADKRNSCRAAERKESWDKAIELCEEAVQIANSFPEESVRTREILQAHEAYGTALAGNDRWIAALEQFQLVAGLAKKYSRSGELGYGDALFLLAFTEAKLANNAAADSDYLLAETSYRDAIVKSPGSKDENAARLADVLARHAFLADQMGESPKAKEMRDEAKKIDHKVTLTNHSTLPQFGLGANPLLAR